MKKIIFALILTLFFCGLVPCVNAATVTLSWDANTESDLAGYKLHWGTESGVYANTIDVKNVVTFKVSDLPEGKLFFAATAYDTADNESGYSNEVTVTLNTVAPGNPTNLRVIINEAREVIIEIDEY